MESKASLLSFKTFLGEFPPTKNSLFFGDARKVFASFFSFLSSAQGASLFSSLSFSASFGTGYIAKKGRRKVAKSWGKRGRDFSWRDLLAIMKKFEMQWSGMAWQKYPVRSRKSWKLFLCAYIKSLHGFWPLQLAHTQASLWLYVFLALPSNCCAFFCSISALVIRDLGPYSAHPTCTYKCVDPS